MPTDDRKIASEAFSTPEWRSAADSLFQATGVTVSVMDFGSCELLAGVSRCAAAMCVAMDSIKGAVVSPRNFGYDDESMRMFILPMTSP